MKGEGGSTAAFDRAPRWSIGDGFWAGESSPGLVTGSDLGAALFTLELTAGLFGVAGRAAFAAPLRLREFGRQLQRLISFPLWSSVLFVTPPSCFFVLFKANGLAA